MAAAAPETRYPQNLNKRQHFELLRSQLAIERSSFEGHWRILGDYILPRRPRFTTSENNRGERKNQNIIDSTATLASRTLRSGMMSGITSPARPWFKLSTPDADLSEFGRVKDWLEDVTNRMRTMFLRSNIYQTLPNIYGDEGTFATACMFVEEDFESVLRSYAFPIGSYYVSNNALGKVDTIVRDLPMTVRQIVSKFGRKRPGTNFIEDWSNISNHVKGLWENGTTEAWIDVCHVIEPNPDFNSRSPLSKFKRYRSVYYERGSMRGSSTAYISNSDGHDVYLSEKGYDYFPALVTRWDVTGEDVYGTDCPGMTALGDIKQLQLGEKRSMQAVEKKVMPPMVGAPALRTTKASILPGDMTYLEERDGKQGFRPAHLVDLSIQELEAKQEQCRTRIERAYYVDLFLMLAQSDRREITAREIEERHEEKLLALGPVLERQNQDLLDPLVDLGFDFMLRQNMIPPPPEELEGMPLKVEYISVMAQAQKMVGISSMERFSSFVGALAKETGDPAVIDKVDVDELVDQYGDALGISANIIRSDDEVAAIRQGRAEQQEKAQAAEQALATAATAKTLSETDLSKKGTALKRLEEQAQAGELAPA